MTNCINCGAPLHGDKCAYCGTEYRNGAFVCDLGKNDFTGKLIVDGKDYSVYLGHVEGNLVSLGGGRDERGIFRRGNTVMKRKFTLIEI